MSSDAAECLENAVGALNRSAGSIQERLRDAWRAVQPLMFTDAMLHSREQRQLRDDLFDCFPAGAELPGDSAILALSTQAASAIAGEIAQLHASFIVEVRGRVRRTAERDVPAQGFYPLDHDFRQPQRRRPGAAPVMSGAWATIAGKTSG